MEDNGVGIPERSKDKVFEMFYRAHDEMVGSGLGLYIVKEVVDKLEGSIEIESDLGVVGGELSGAPVVCGRQDRRLDALGGAVGNRREPAE